MKLVMAFLVGAGVSGLISTAAAAATSLAEGGILNQLMAENLSLGDQRTSCANFTGAWKGDCEIRESLEGSPAPAQVTRRTEQMLIQQTGCSTLEGGHFGRALIGASRTEATATPSGSKSETINLFWQDDGKVLKLIIPFQLVKYGADKPVYWGKHEGTFKVEGESIVVSMESGIVQQDPRTQGLTKSLVESRCTLNKLASVHE